MTFKEWVNLEIDDVVELNDEYYKHHRIEPNERLTAIVINHDNNKPILKPILRTLNSITSPVFVETGRILEYEDPRYWQKRGASRPKPEHRINLLEV